MQAALYNFNSRQMRVGNLEKPDPGPGEALVRVEAVGLCGSDVHFFLHGTTGEQFCDGDFVLGHEYSGRVEQLGPGVNQPELAIGRRVAVEPTIACGGCEFCLCGRGNLCPALKFTGTPPTLGALREYVVMPTQNLFPLPEGMSSMQGALMEPLTVALHACRLAGSLVGRTVAIVGAGPIGLLIQQLVLLFGAQLVAVSETLAYRRAMAQRFGAGLTINPVTENESQTREKLGHGGLGAQVVFEAAGTPAGLAHALGLARPGGTVIYVGICPVPMTIDFTCARRRELTLQWVRRTIGCYPAAIELVRKNLVDVESLATHRCGLEGVGAALKRQADYADEVIKTVVEF